MWVDYRGSLSTVYNDGEISTCGWITEIHSVQSTVMEFSQHLVNHLVEDSTFYPWLPPWDDML